MGGERESSQIWVAIQYSNKKKHESHWKITGTPSESHRKTMGQSLENHWKIRAETLAYHWEIIVFWGIPGCSPAYSRVSAGIVAGPRYPYVSWCILERPGVSWRSPSEPRGKTCGVLRSPAASKKPRFPFLCTHRFF